jgi:hypothetical protein
MKSLAEQVWDAQRAVAGWSKEKRESVQLQGGVIDPRSYTPTLPPASGVAIPDASIPDKGEKNGT